MNDVRHKSTNGQPDCPKGHRRSRRVKAGDWKGHRECVICGTRFNRDGTR